MHRCLASFTNTPTHLHGCVHAHLHTHSHANMHAHACSSEHTYTHLHARAHAGRTRASSAARNACFPARPMRQAPPPPRAARCAARRCWAGN